MAPCHIQLNPLSNLMGLNYWVALTVVIFLLCTRFTWDDNKYAFFRLQAMFISQSVLFYYIYFWIGLNSFSAWLVWFCHDWDADPVTLIFYIVKIMMISFVGPAFMLTTRIWIPITMSILALIASIVNCVLFSLKNDWAGICGIVDIITMSIIIIILADIAVFKKAALRAWVTVQKNPKDLFDVKANDGATPDEEEEAMIESKRKRTQVNSDRQPSLKF